MSAVPPFDSSEMAVEAIDADVAVGGPQDRRELAQRVNALLEKGAKNIVLDCRLADAIDARSLGLFVRLNSLAERKGAQLRITNLGQELRNYLELTKLDRVLTIDARADTSQAAA